MSAPIITRPPDLQAYLDDLQAYEIRFADWLGIDPHAVAHLIEARKPVGGAAASTGMPDDLLVTWESFDHVAEADEHEGRHPLPASARGTYGAPTVVTNGVVLDSREVQRLRAEVGDRPEFPTPAGGWPKGWGSPSS